MNDPKMLYFAELIFADNGFKRDFEFIFADDQYLFIFCRFGRKQFLPLR